MVGKAAHSYNRAAVPTRQNPQITPGEDWAGISRERVVLLLRKVKRSVTWKSRRKPTGWRLKTTDEDSCFGWGGKPVFKNSVRNASIICALQWVQNLHYFHAPPGQRKVIREAVVSSPTHSNPSSASSRRRRGKNAKTQIPPPAPTYASVEQRGE